MTSKMSMTVNAVGSSTAETPSVTLGSDNARHGSYVRPTARIEKHFPCLVSSHGDDEGDDQYSPPGTGKQYTQMVVGTASHPLSDCAPASMLRIRIHIVYGGDSLSSTVLVSANRSRWQT